MKSSEPEPEPVASPTACPFCRSVKISTPSEKVDSSTYWRCEACGQMWNVARHSASQRPSYGRRSWNKDY